MRWFSANTGGWRQAQMLAPMQVNMSSELTLNELSRLPLTLAFEMKKRNKSTE